MPDTTRKGGPTPSELQDSQERLVDEARRIPGVAEALAVYRSVEPYVRPVSQRPVVVRFSTGGNP